MNRSQGRLVRDATLTGMLTLIGLAVVGGCTSSSGSTDEVDCSDYATYGSSADFTCLEVSSEVAPDILVGLIADDLPEQFEGMRRTLPITCNYRETTQGEPAPWGCEGLWRAESDPDSVVRALIVVSTEGGKSPQDVVASGAAYKATVVVAAGRCSDPAFEPGVCDYFADLAQDLTSR